MTKTEINRLKKVTESINGLLQTIRSMEARRNQMVLNTIEERNLSTKIRQLQAAHSKLVRAAQGVVGLLL